MPEDNALNLAVSSAGPVDGSWLAATAAFYPWDVSHSSMNKFQPEQFERLSGNAQVETELRHWLRGLPVAERIDFIRRLWALNSKFAISLVRSSQIPAREAVSLLQYWLSLNNHNAAERLIEGFVPMLGEDRFWQAAAELELEPAMEDFLNYYGRGQLQRHKTARRSFNRTR